MSQTEFVSGAADNASPAQASTQTKHDPIVQDKKSQFRLIAAGTIGNGLEIFDFIVYSYFAEYIGAVFFNADSSLGSLLISLSVYLVGFVPRPLGAIVLGSYADKYGRRSCMMLAMSLMGFGSLMIACAPTPDMVGPIAPVFIIVARLIQGFSTAAELTATANLIAESAPADKRGFFICWPDAVQGVTTFAGSTVAWIITSLLTHEQMLSFGWRIPFFIGLIIVPYGVYMRRELKETLNVERVDKKRNLLKVFFRDYWKLGVLLILMSCHGTIVMYTFLLWMIHYVNNMPGITVNGHILTTVSSVIYVIATIFGGPLADKMVHRKKFVLRMLIALFICIWMTFLFSHVSVLFVFFHAACIFIMGCYGAASSLFTLPAFPQFIRVTAFSVLGSLNVLIFGATSQLINTQLLIWTDNYYLAPAFYVSLSVLVSYFATRAFPEKEAISLIDDYDAPATVEGGINMEQKI